MYARFNREGGLWQWAGNTWLTCIYIYIHLFIYVYAYIYACMNIYTHTYIYIDQVDPNPRFTPDIHPGVVAVGGKQVATCQVPIGLYKIFVHSIAGMYSAIIMSLPPPSAFLTLLQYFCTTNVEDTPPHPTPLMYAIHRTILAMAISCKGQGAEH